MKVVIRADASLQIGTGHVMRCLTLARALREEGAECDFICREHPGHLLEYLQAEGFKVHRLPLPQERRQTVPDAVPHADWLGVNWDEDARLCANILRSANYTWLIMDHYALDARWQRTLQPYAARLLVVDDLADRPHVCQILLDQNLGRHASDYAHLVPPDCQLLCGPEFALLRPEFAALRSQSLTRRAALNGIQNILITMGGVDAPNATGLALSALAQAELPEACRISVIMGSTAPWIAQVREQAAAMPVLTEVVVGVNNMAERMAAADLAIGAAGSTSWERCCLGLPCLTVVLADNQLAVAHSLEAAGASWTLPDLASFAQELPGLLQDLQRNPVQLGVMSRAAASLTQGLGVQSILRSLW